MRCGRLLSQRSYKPEKPKKSAKTPVKTPGFFHYGGLSRMAFLWYN
jgi:hypothetical protein